jgi:cell division protein FtsW
MRTTGDSVPARREPVPASRGASPTPNRPAARMPAKHLQSLYLCIVLLLLAAGVVMVYSASSVSAQFDPKINDSLFFVKRQLIFCVLGVAAMLTLARFDYHLLLKHSKKVYIVTLLALVGVIVAGTTVNHAKRWLGLGPFSFQPSEVAKFAVVLMAVVFVLKNREKLTSFKSGFIPACLLIAPLSGLIIVQPDFGTSVFVAALGFVVLLAGGLKMRHVGLVAAVALPIVGVVMFMKFGHVQDRILTFLNPEADKLGKGHQIWQSLIALGSGDFFGNGLGESTQKLFFLPEEHTDFIFAIIVEELGLVGSACIILLFAALAYAGHRVSKHAPDSEGALLALGFTAAIVLQAAMNLAVVTASVPTKGISLPLISFGGTGIVVTLAGCGVVLNVARQAVSREQAIKLRSIEASPGPSLVSLPNPNPPASAPLPPEKVAA